MSRSSSHSRSNLPPASARIRIANEPTLERDYDRDGPIPCSLSLLSARRPSLALSPYDNPQDIINAGLASYRDVPKLGIPGQLDESSSPEFDGGNLRKNFQIIMKDLVGDAVGNVSCSPQRHTGECYIDRSMSLNTCIVSDEYQSCWTRYCPRCVSDHPPPPSLFFYMFFYPVAVAYLLLIWKLPLKCQDFYHKVVLGMLPMCSGIRTVFAQNTLSPRLRKSCKSPASLSFIVSPLFKPHLESYDVGKDIHRAHLAFALPRHY